MTNNNLHVVTDIPRGPEGICLDDIVPTVQRIIEAFPSGDVVLVGDMALIMHFLTV